MRPAVQPLRICILDTLSQRSTTPLFTARSLPRNRSLAAALCIHCKFQSTFAHAGGDGLRRGKTASFLPYNPRRWESGTPKSGEDQGKAGSSPDDEVEERLRKIKEEYTARELRARAPPPPPPPPPTPLPKDPEGEPEQERVDTKSPISSSPPTASTPQKTLPMPPPASTKPPSPAAFRFPTRPRIRIPERLFPSYAALNRSDLTARFHQKMEQLLATITVASQRLNTYTGTDYSGISALRSEIGVQEQIVKAAHTAVASAKQAYTAAFAAQAASQKEVVQLLERKHSWSATDLERYMSLIRSEHLNEQAVQAAKEGLSVKERALEDARGKLERIERKQYHEEQVWSDTIRRNSTWVTFGLMGFNVVLLLTSLLIFEPWRRRRIMREIRNALDEKTLVVPTAAGQDASAILAATINTNTAASTETSSATAPVKVAEAATDAVIPPVKDTLEGIEKEIHIESPAVAAGSIDEPEHPPPVASLTTPTTAPTTSDDTSPLTPSNSPPDPVDAASTPPPSPPSPPTISPPPTTTPPQQPQIPTLTYPFYAETWQATYTLYKAYWADLFSERRIALRKVDLTATALEGAAAGAACMGLLFVLLRPR